MIVKVILFLMMIYFMVDSFMIDSAAQSAMHQILGSMSMIKALLVGIILSVLHSKGK